MMTTMTMMIMMTTMTMMIMMTMMLKWLQCLVTTRHQTNPIFRADVDNNDNILIGNGDADNDVDQDNDQDNDQDQDGRWECGRCEIEWV